jgi:hypothetical protein
VIYICVRLTNLIILHEHQLYYFIIAVGKAGVKLAKQFGADYALDVISQEPWKLKKMVEECFGEMPLIK